MIKIKILIFCILVIFFNNTVYSNIKIIYKINNEIITSFDIQNEINYLIALKEGANIIDASQSYFDDISHSKSYFMAEELPFSIKLSNDKVLTNDVVNKFFLSDRIQHFLNG